MKKIFYTAFSLLLILFPLTTPAQNNIPGQGKIQTLKMPCKLLKGISEHEYSIYLPGSYDTNEQKSYPVLYLMHGGGGSNTDWKIAVGDKDFTLEANMDLMKAFREKGVPCSMYVNDGATRCKMGK